MEQFVTKIANQNLKANSQRETHNIIRHLCERQNDTQQSS